MLDELQAKAELLTAHEIYNLRREIDMMLITIEQIKRREAQETSPTTVIGFNNRKIQK